MNEIFDYEEYSNFMESKKVRHGADRTNTLLDFVSEEQYKKDKENGIVGNDISMYDPTPKDIKEHFNFIIKIFRELREKYPNDKYLDDLANKEEKQIEKFSTNWYVKYGIEK